MRGRLLFMFEFLAEAMQNFAVVHIGELVVERKRKEKEKQIEETGRLLGKGNGRG